MAYYTKIRSLVSNNHVVILFTQKASNSKCKSTSVHTNRTLS